MKHFLSTTVVSLMTLTATMSYAYEIETGAKVGILNPEHQNTGYNLGLNGTYYLKNVRNHHQVPLAESAFVNKASHIRADAQWNDIGASKLNTYSLSSEYFIPATLLVANAKLSRNNTDNKSTHYSAELGYMPVNSLLVAIGATGYTSQKIDGIDPTIRAKYLTKIANNYVNLEGSMSFGDLDEYNLSADYYLDKTLSVGADYYQDKISNYKVFGFKAEKFFTTNTSLGGRITFGDANNTNYNSFGINGKYRF